MKVCELYNIENVYLCETKDDAKNCFNMLRSKIGTIPTDYPDGSLSKKQSIVAHTAMMRILKKRLCSGIVFCV